jgi:hypothetical protein
MSWIDDWVWLRVDSRRRAQNAIEEGFWAATFVCGMTAVFLLINVLKDTEQLAVGEVLAVVAFAFIAFGVRRRSRAAALAALILYVLDRVYALVSGVHGNLILPVLITLAFLNAVRGTLAYHRFPPLPANLPSVEQSFKAMGNPSPKSEEDTTTGAQ